MKRFSLVVRCAMVIAMLIFSVTSFAQSAPHKITHQGTLKYLDTSSKLKIPKAGAYMLQFDFYDAASGGTSKATIAPPTGITIDKTGMYTIVFGEDGTDTGNFDLSIFNNQLLWLQVTILSGPDTKVPYGTTGYVVPPGRVQLTTVPYAAYAQSTAHATYAQSTAGISVADDGTVTIAGGTKLGTNAPAIKIIKLTGTTADTQGGFTTVSHGLDSSKILSMEIMVDVGMGQYIPAAHYRINGFELNYWYNAFDIYINTTETNSSSILSKPVKIMVTYEQ